mmetsp:Transcript_1930/g.5800  ORF Transcript_1930/g.5800 Transcript_1930/m.5800 type:complete len:232 (+) Transcript_1930:625-1320(+)
MSAARAATSARAGAIRESGNHSVRRLAEADVARSPTATSSHRTHTPSSAASAPGAPPIFASKPEPPAQMMPQTPRWFTLPKSALASSGGSTVTMAPGTSQPPEGGPQSKRRASSTSGTGPPSSRAAASQSRMLLSWLKMPKPRARSRATAKLEAAAFSRPAPTLPAAPTAPRLPSAPSPAPPRWPSKVPRIRFKSGRISWAAGSCMISTGWRVISGGSRRPVNQSKIVSVK